MRTDRILDLRYGLAGAAILVVGWWVVADTFFAQSKVVPSPAALVTQIGKDGPYYYLHQVAITAGSAARGYVAGVGAALLLAAVVMIIPPLAGAAGQLALFVECAPAAAIGPVLLAVTTGRLPSILLAAIAVFFSTLVGALLGLHSSRAVEHDIIAVYGGNRWDRFRKVRLPAAAPAVFAALQIAVPSALLGAILGEYLGGVDSGIGVALAVASRDIQVQRTWIFGLSAAVVAAGGYGLMGVLRRVLLPWLPGSRRW
ncbi:MAG: ABC transporter permease subunit [Gordonia sp. (in: high G+C Gram-positive bacteria)]